MGNAIQMENHLKYRLLEAMGISIWIEKRTSALMSDSPILGAALLVLLPERLRAVEQEQQKILTGMLKVLELGEAELCVAWLSPFKEKDREEIGKAINQWAPYRVLVLGESLAQFLLSTSIGLDEIKLSSQPIVGVISPLDFTYHPAELENSLVCKRKAYQDLLRLKSQIAEARKV